MKKKYLAAVIVLVVFGVAFVLYQKSITTDQPPLEDMVSNKTYSNSKFGFSFNYPDKYIVEERNLDTSNRYHTSLVLMPKGYIPPIGGEGPTTINVDIYQNNLDMLSVESWIKGTAVSNYKLGDGILTEINVGGKEALAYNWDGLYRGQTVVFEHNQNIIAVSETFLNSSDEIRSDYQKVLNSFIFTDFSNNSKLPQTLVENYLKENISNLSSEKETLGGKFYLTSLVLHDGKSGTVNYEDGHNAFIADFSYGISSDGKILVTNFIIRK